MLSPLLPGGRRLPALLKQKLLQKVSKIPPDAQQTIPLEEETAEAGSQPHLVVLIDVCMACAPFVSHTLQRPNALPQDIPRKVIPCGVNVAGLGCPVAPIFSHS